MSGSMLHSSASEVSLQVLAALHPRPSLASSDSAPSLHVAALGRAASPPPVAVVSRLDVANVFAAAGGYAVTDDLAAIVEPTLLLRGKQLWRVLRDAVGLRVHREHSPDQAGEEESVLAQRMRFFRGLALTLGTIAKWKHDKLLHLCTRVQERRYTGRVVVYRQSEPSTHVFFVHSGTVQLQRTTREGGANHYLDMYSDHLVNEKLQHRTHAKSALDVTTGSGTLRTVSFEAVATHEPNTGQEEVRHARAAAGASTLSSGQGYTLLREFDYFAGRVTRNNSTQYFALQFHHVGYSLRLNVQAHRGAAEIFVCTQALLPSPTKYTWTAGTNLSAKENAYMASFNSTTLAGRGGPGNAPLTPIAQQPIPEEKDADDESGSGTSAHPGQRHHSCELNISASHPQFKRGWFYICIAAPKGNSCDFSLRVAAVPVEGGPWRPGSSARAPNVSGLASLSRGALFGLDGAVNNAARDEEAVAHGETVVYAVPRDEFLACFPTIGGAPNPALTELTRNSTNLRRHRAQLHQDTLQLAHTQRPIASRVDTLELGLSHYDKLAQQRLMLSTALQRFEDRQVNKAKLQTLEAAQVASGVVAKKPVLSSDAQRLRINHHYKRRANGDAASAAQDAGLSFDSQGQSPSELPDVEASGTTGPSQRRVRRGAQEHARQNVLQDEVRMLSDFLREETRDQHPKRKPAPTHHSLLVRQVKHAHAEQLVRQKVSHGIGPSQHIGLDMHKLLRGDVGVHEQEMHDIAEHNTLDDIVANRVPLPLPPPERLLSTEEQMLALKLSQMPRYEPVRPPAERPKPPPIKKSEAFAISGELMANLLRPSSALGQLGSLEPPSDLESLETRFAKETPPSALLALEAGSWIPPPISHSTPRLVSPTRRKRREEAQQWSPIAAPTPLPTPNQVAQKGTKNVKTMRAAIAIYSDIDPSLDALRDFNQSVEATYAREQEFTHAYRAAGKEARTREWVARPAARPSHPLANGRIDSLADVAPHALQKSWSLLTSSASSPLLLMAPEPSMLAGPSKTGDDSSVFLTYVDAHEDEDENEDVLHYTHQDEPLLNSLVDESIVPSPHSSAQSSPKVKSMLPPVVVPGIPSRPHSNRAASVAAAVSALSHRSLCGDASSQRLITFDPAPATEHPPSSSLAGSQVVSVAGVSLRSLPLDGLSAGAIDTDLPTVGTGFVVAPDARSLPRQDFPPSAPSPDRMIELARMLGHQPAKMKPLSLKRIKDESGSFARELAQSASLSTPLGLKNSPTNGMGKLKPPVGYAAKSAVVRALEERRREEDGSSISSTSRPQTAMGRMLTHHTTEEEDEDATSEIWDVDDYVDLEPQQPVRVAKMMRPSSSAGRLSSPHGFGSSLPHAVVPVKVTTPAPVELSLLGVSQSTGSLGFSSTMPLDRSVKNAGKHGHPARIGPSYLSNSSADVPAMVWLEERMASRGQPEEPPAPGLSTHPPWSVPDDPQAITRPVSAPLAAFNQANVIPQFVSPVERQSSLPKKKSTKTYFQPAPAKKTRRTTSAKSSPDGSRPASAVRTGPTSLALATKPSAPSVPLPLSSSQKPSALLSMLTSIPATQEPVWELHKNKSGTVSSHFTRRGSITMPAGIIDAAFLAAVGVPLTVAEAEAAQKELHDRRMASAKRARQLAEGQQSHRDVTFALPPDADESAGTPVPVSVAESASLLPRRPSEVSSPSHMRHGSFSFSEIVGSFSVAKRAAVRLHERALSGSSWAAHLHLQPLAGGVNNASGAPSQSATEDALVSAPESPLSEVTPLPVLPARHPLDLPSSLLVPPRLKSLPVPAPAPASVYIKPKMNPFVNAPMMKF